jgi:hypothetical protein
MLQWKKKGEKHDHVHAWGSFEMIIKFILNFFSCCFIFCCSTYWFVSISHDHIELLCQFLIELLSFNFLWPYWIVGSIYCWIGVAIFMIIFFQFSYWQHTIQKIVTQISRTWKGTRYVCFHVHIVNRY